jgi:hypothetical protein
MTEITVYCDYLTSSLTGTGTQREAWKNYIMSILNLSLANEIESGGSGA